MDVIIISLIFSIFLIPTLYYFVSLRLKPSIKSDNYDIKVLVTSRSDKELLNLWSLELSKIGYRTLKIDKSEYSLYAIPEFLIHSGLIIKIRQLSDHNYEITLNEKLFTLGSVARKYRKMDELTNHLFIFNKEQNIEFLYEHSF